MQETKLSMWKNKKVRVPTILQMEPAECGVACLAMIFSHYGLYRSLDQLRTECGVSRDGSKTSNLLNVAKKYGMDAQEHNITAEEVRNFHLPMVLFWQKKHYVVLEGIIGNKVYLCDPNSGPTKITFNDFKKSFSNEALIFVPGPEFKKSGEKPSIYKALSKRFSHCMIPLIFIVLTGLFLIVPGIANPTFIKVFLDDVLLLNLLNWFRPLLSIMVIAAIIQLTLTWFQQYYLAKLQIKISLKESVKFLYHVFRLPVDYFSQRFSGDIAQRVSLNDNLAQILSGQLAVTIIQMFTVCVYAIFLLQYSVLLALIGITIAICNLIVLRLVAYQRTSLSMVTQQEYGKIMGLTMNGIQMVDTLKATSSESEYFAKWTGFQAKYINAEQKLNLSTRLLSVVPSFLNTLNQVVMLFVGALLIMAGNLTIGALFAFQGLMNCFMQPFSNFVNMGSSIQDAHSYVMRLDDVMSNPKDDIFTKSHIVNEVDKNKIPPKLTGTLELKNITFGYSRLADPLITNFSLKLEPGNRVALVGGSGSGKSTIAKLVTGLYSPWEGEVLFDGINIQKIPRDIFTNSVAMVDQDIFLFGGSVRDNITMWDNTISEKYVTDAAKDACIHDVVVARPGGYYGRVAEGGANFSGGQSQRLEIARTLAGLPNIVILDEATSALDPNTEKDIDTNLRKRGCTCLIVAHRLSTIRDCDEIIVLERGKVVQRGVHEELKNERGLYAELIKAA